MKLGSGVLFLLLILSAGNFLSESAHGQSTKAPVATKTLRFTCSPAPCVLPPTQASEGGSIVTDSFIVSDPLNRKQLLLGSVDGNCDPSVLGFHLSRDGGSTWNRVLCMPFIYRKNLVYQPGGEPSVGYDRNGTANVAGIYFGNGSGTYGLLAVQKSTDGSHWSKPVVALRLPGQTYPFETGFTVDTNAGSPLVNSLYVSGVMYMGLGFKRQILVSHSTDGGVTWKKVAADAIQTYPAKDDFTRMTVGKNGTIYLTWLHCVRTGPDKACRDDNAYMMFSKSTNGGNSWAPPRLMTKATYPPNGTLPNTQGVNGCTTTR